MSEGSPLFGTPAPLWALALPVVMLLTAPTGCAPGVDDPGGSSAQAREEQTVDFLCRGCNLVVVSIDTLRADRLSVYGHSRPTSPHLEAMAAEGVVFDDFIHSGGGTLPSHMSMMTSLNPAVHGLQPVPSQSPLASGRVTLAERLAENDYQTAAFVDGGWMRGKFGFTQGFGVYDDAGGGFAAIRPKAEDWLRKRDREPFFLFLHSYDVHSQGHRLPYDCPGDFPHRYTAEIETSFDGCVDGLCATKLLKSINEQVEREGRRPGHAPRLGEAEIDYLKALYDGCINYADEQVGLLVAHLRELGLLDRTLLVVTSDHGEEFFEHGHGLHTQGGYEAIAHIPLIMRWPDRRLAGTRVSSLAAMIDLMPTLLAVLDMSVPEEAQGRSLMPAVVEGVPVRREMNLYSMLRTEEWKLLTPRDEMYHLATDPHEQTNRWTADPATRETLEKRVRRLVYEDRVARQRLTATDAAAEGDPTANLSDEEVEELKALGYL